MNPSPRSANPDYSPRLIGVCMAWAMFAFGFVGHAEPHVPSSGSEILERLNVNVSGKQARQVRELQQRTLADRDNPALACELARFWIQQSRLESNPRYLGRAQAAFSPWWTQPGPN